MSKQAESDELKTLRRIAELLETIAKQQLATVISANISTPKLKQLYELTGVEPVKSLAKKTGLPTGTISRTWQKWEALGLLRKDGKRYRKVF